MKAEDILRRVRYDFPEQGEIIVGLSGGADSVLLTHLLLMKYGAARIHCVHVDHMLRGAESDRDAAFAKDFCGERGVRFTCFRRDVAKLARERGESIETCARNVRYDCFAEVCQSPEDCIVTAHNADDNAETVLLHLTRGAGPAGAAGIPPARGAVRRPLLRISRVEVEFLCEIFKLRYVMDSTNAEPLYTRNRLRLNVMPVLKEINPRFTESISRFSESMALQNEFIREEAKALLKRAETPYGLSLPVLRTAHSAVLRAALEDFLTPCGALDFGHVTGTEECVRSGGRMSLPRGGKLEAKQDTLTLSFESHKAFSVEISGAETLLPDGRRLLLEKKEKFEKTQNVHNLFFNNALDCAKIIGVPVIRTRREGDRFAPAGRNLHKSVKKLMNELRIPAAVRDTLLLMELEGEIVWAEGVGPAEGYAVTEETEQALVLRVVSGKE